MGFEFDWVLFLSISIIGPIFGNRLCTELEKRVTGEVRKEIEFKNKRVKSTIISIGLGYVITRPIMDRIQEKLILDSELAMRLLSIIIGVIVYLLFQRVIYRFMLRNY
jgi:hypothetical protein